MTRRSMRSPRSAFFAAWLLAASAAAPATTPITIDDLLDAESLGSAEFSPDGGRLVFAREMPYSQRTTWGYDDSQQVGERVFVTSLDGAATREIAASADVRYSLLPEKGWAPDGRGLLLMATTSEGYGFAYSDLGGAPVALPGRPLDYFPAFDWTADARIVYAAWPDTALQRGAHAQVIEGAAARWRDGWNGRSAPLTVSAANDVFATTVPASGRLMLAAPRRGQSAKIADGDYAAVAVAPGGRYVAAVRLAEKIPEALGLSARRGELQIFRLDADGATLLHRYEDIDTGERGALAWSPSGRRLLVAAKPAQAARAATHLYDIDASAGRRRELPAAGLSFVDPAAENLGGVLPLGWIGERPAAVAARRDTAAKDAPRSPGRLEARLEYGENENWRFDVYAFDGERASNLTAFAKTSVNAFLVPDDGARAFVVADGAAWSLTPGSAPRRLSPAGAPTVVGFGSDRRYPEPPPRTAYYHAGGVERLALYALDAQQEPQRVVLDLKSGQTTALSGEGEIAATSPDQLATVRKIRRGWTAALRLDGAGARTLAEVNAALENRAIAEAERFEYRYDGKPLIGWVLRPPGAAAGMPLPALVSVYGGLVLDAAPHGTQADVDPPAFSGQLLAAQGYAVVFPSTPLGAGAETDLMATLAGETVAAIDALAARGIVDPQRVGVMGQSFGGYSTAAILAKRSDRFKAGVAMAGIYDWTYAYGTRALEETLSGDGRISPAEMTFVEIGQPRLAKPFWIDPAPYRRNSPIFHVEHLDAPLLLLHGDMDMGITGLPGAERMYSALVRAGKKPALVRYGGEGHVAQSVGAMRDQWQRITTWFAHYVKGEGAGAAPAGPHQPAGGAAPR